MSYNLLVNLVRYTESKENYNEAEKKVIEADFKLQTKKALSKIGDGIVNTIDAINES